MTRRARRRSWTRKSVNALGGTSTKTRHILWRTLTSRFLWQAGKKNDEGRQHRLAALFKTNMMESSEDD
ncbi:hypothetical protein [Mesobacillus foraminis]|uniref:hypothetical protein n=1 Tax=Mesobacillus foraminis TaxID=279826 RepID=UPI00105245E1|nr:hypothetical protein [Mesobacillus foraminis]